MADPTFLLFPGQIRSKNDGDCHFISAGQLINCYQLDPRQCAIYNPTMHKLTDPAVRNRVWLEPRYHGDYLQYKERAIASWQRQQLQSIANKEEDHANTN